MDSITKISSVIVVINRRYFLSIDSGISKDTCWLVGRSIVWLQNKRDATLERLRGPSPRREDTHEFRVGRLKHERVCVPRDDSLLEWAMQVMKYHAERKAVLEVIGTIDSLSYY